MNFNYKTSWRRSAKMASSKAVGSRRFRLIEIALDKRGCLIKCFIIMARLSLAYDIFNFRCYGNRFAEMCTKK